MVLIEPDRSVQSVPGSHQVYSFCPETCVWKGQGSFECAGFNAGAVGIRDRIYILGGDYSPDEITDEVQVRKSCLFTKTVSYDVVVLPESG